MHASPFPLPRWLFPATLIFILACFAVRNLPWHLDDYDQAKQAYVSFEMVQEGAWWFQHTPSGRIATKPPLAGWISAGLALITGKQAWELAWRLPSFLSALVILWILVTAGRRLAGTLGATIAAAAFGLNLMTPRLATLVRTDMMLGLTIFLVGYLIYEKLRRDQPWTTRDRCQLFGLLLASMLLKGPIAYAFLLPGLVAFVWLNRRTPAAARAWSGWWSWLAPLAFFAVWVVVGIALSKDFYEQVVRDEFLGRFTVGEGARHNNQPIYFYLPKLLHLFFPWSALLIALAAVPDVRAKLRRDPALFWLVCWALGGLIFMSLVPSKRADRVFSSLPPLCLLAAGLVSLMPAHRFTAWFSPRAVYLVLGVAALFSSGYAVFRLVEGYRTDQGALVEFGREARVKAPPGQLAVVHGKDEGMLLYLRVSQFTKRDEAIAQWQAGRLGGLVLPDSVLDEHRAAFLPFQVALRSRPAREKNSSYSLLVPHR